MTTTDILGVVQVDGREQLLFGNGLTDGSLAELKTYDDTGTARSLGEHFEGGILEKIKLQASDGSILTTVQLVDDTGGLYGSWRGNERKAASFLGWNLVVTGLDHSIKRGDIIKVNPTD